MAQMFLFCFLLHLEGIWQVWGNRSLQPYGPKLCEARCQRSNCSAKIFDEIQLSCELNMKQTTAYRRCHNSNEDDIEVVGTSAMQGRGCSSVTLSSFVDACEEGNQLEVERLVGQELLDVNCRADEDGNTLVMYAIMNNMTRVFDLLVQQKCDLKARNLDKRSVLHFASYECVTDIVRILIDNHCSDIECRDHKGITPLMLAAFGGCVSVVKLLKDRGADMTAVDKSNNNILIYACLDGNEDMVKYVLSLHIIDLECKGLYGRTALMGAVLSGHISIVKILLQHKAKITTLTDDNANVLHMASYFKKLRMLKYLVSLEEVRGLERREDNYGRTPIEQAEFLGHTEILSVLESMID